MRRLDDAYLRVTGLDKTYASRSGSVRALKGVEFAVAQGEFVSILGPSGCGKSTLLKILLGVVPADGEIWLGGQRVNGPRVEIGAVFQSPVLPPWRKVIDNVMLPVEVLKWPKEKHRARALELLHLVGLEGFESRYPHELSGGMQQRVSICRALIHRPSLLLMDEPFGALDAISREEMQVELLRIWSEMGGTVIFVTHSIDEAVLLSDRVLVMSPRPGRVKHEAVITLGRPRTQEMREAFDFQRQAAALRAALGVIPKDRPLRASESEANP